MWCNVGTVLVQPSTASDWPKPNLKPRQENLPRFSINTTTPTKPNIYHPLSRASHFTSEKGNETSTSTPTHKTNRHRPSYSARRARRTRLPYPLGPIPLRATRHTTKKKATLNSPTLPHPQHHRRKDGRRRVLRRWRQAQAKGE